MSDEVKQVRRGARGRSLHSKAKIVVSSQLILSLAAEAASIGVDPHEVLARLKLPFRFGDILDGSIAVISAYQFVLIFREFIIPLAEHASQEVNHPPMKMSEIELLCYCVVSSRTLTEALGRASQFCAMVGDRCAALSTDVSQFDASFSMRTARKFNSVCALHSDLIGLSFYHRLFSWLIGEDIPISALEVVHDEAVFERRLCEEIYCRPVKFGARRNGFRFPNSSLDKPVVRSSRELMDLIGLFAVDTLGYQQPRVRLSEAIERVIATRLGEGELAPTPAQFASYFNLSEATLRRRLRDEDASYTLIRERCQIDFAKATLSALGATKISELSARLGFYDPSTFRRAFVRWTGLTPDNYRAQARAG